MPLLTLIDGQLAYGELPLLDRASFSMDSGERIGLIGRNGSGKSSLLSIIAGITMLDDGELRRNEGLVVSLVEQEPRLPQAPTVSASLLLRGGIPDMHDERRRWRTEARLSEFLHRFGLKEDVAPERLSGGESKRAALALALAIEPDLLLLDEPTNHLDVEGIEQLETLLARQAAAIVVTHDRTFLDRFATRILELDRGLLRSYPGNFTEYEKVKADQLGAEALAQRRFDKFWAEEEIWIRKGVEARRTRNAGRVKRLERLREERAARRERQGTVKVAIGAGERSGKVVAELRQVSKSFGGRAVVKNLDLVVGRGDRIGLIGANGAGKTTLIKLILGVIPPDEGNVRLGTNVQPAYFDQMREALDPNRTVAETISPGSDWVEINGVRKHVMSYLGDFLFPPRRANAPVRMLSGGERNRLLLARLFARPANLLVLDEPTNDLDIESLELLEAALQDYSGTLLLVSHDRAFLDAVVTQTVAAEGAGQWKEYVGGYSDWLRQRPEPPAEDRKPVARPGPPARERTRVRMSYKETRELLSLPQEIEILEAEQQALTARMSQADYYRQPVEYVRADRQRSVEIEALLMEKLERWEQLEEKAKAAAGGQ